MNSKDIRRMVEDRGRVLIDDFTCPITPSEFRSQAIITAIRLGRLLGTKRGRTIMNDAGYDKTGLIVIADGYKSIDELNEKMALNGYPAFIAFTENNTLTVGVIEEPQDIIFTEEELQDAENFQQVIEDIYYACNKKGE